jgi:site-specific DNA-methyltransferase (adenine-specific)
LPESRQQEDLMTDELGWRNKLFYGDNLQIMRDYISDDSLDLIYLDPPWKSNQNYNVLFAEKDGKASPAQITVFEDTWHWDRASEATYWEIVKEGPKKLSDLMQALRSFLGSNDLLAYLVMMAIRLVEMRRVLKPTGSIVLHCDCTSSHYLKLVMDAAFGPRNFRNEIIWKRKTGRGETNHKAKRFGVSTDTLLFYTKTNNYYFEGQFTFEAKGYQDYVD